MPDDAKPAAITARPETPVEASVGSHIQDFIFARELSEVYLLLDNVSMSIGKSLPAAPKVGTDDPPDLIEQICQIGWPPTGSTADRAHQAAVLLRARDTLNSAAAPATGATIAFTLLVAGEGGGLSGGSKRLDPVPSASSAWAPGVGWSQGDAPSRVSLAIMAFPNLRREARRFQTWIPIIVCALFAMFLMTSWLSWDISVGNSALAEWNKVKAVASQDAGDGAATAAATAGRPAALTAQQLQSERDVAFSGANLRHWLKFWQFLLGGPAQVERVDCGAGGCPAGLGLNVNEKWAGEILNVLGGAVLPTLYGLLGAGAAVVRTMSARIRESLLSPRHLQLTFVQLTLGALIGGCIGLFVTPSGAPSSAAPGLLGSVPLSASALCFLAGFGVDGVFQALEGLMQRVFSIPDPTKRLPPAGH
jgi:hypothetical protein